MLENDGKKASIHPCWRSLFDFRLWLSREERDFRAERARAQHRAPLATRLTSHEGEKLRTLIGGGSEGSTEPPSSVCCYFGPWK